MLTFKITQLDKSEVKFKFKFLRIIDALNFQIPMHPKKFYIRPEEFPIYFQNIRLNSTIKRFYLYVCSRSQIM